MYWKRAGGGGGGVGRTPPPPMVPPDPGAEGAGNFFLRRNPLAPKARKKNLAQTVEGEEGSRAACRSRSAPHMHVLVCICSNVEAVHG